MLGNYKTQNYDWVMGSNPPIAFSKRVRCPPSGYFLPLSNPPPAFSIEGGILYCPILKGKSAGICKLLSPPSICVFCHINIFIGLFIYNTY
ncbi:hypothetical protein GDO86_019745 [Hymenochirus boettgeri]|uniref:Uncharacterized protein n=1 Tax=Hymenochirus boettgeri TaxID=247094 RepID=A0A8T2IIM3_9PIPI|nr:hypothetical protein GDO86_019745 [Hymenochirus boettgeri]